MTIKHFLFLLPLLSLVSPASSQESCDAILANGYKNIEISKGASSAIATKYYNYCRKNLDESNSSLMAQASVEVLGYGGGSAGLSSSDVKKKIDDWCETNKSTAQNNQASYVESQQISSAAVNAWVACKAIAIGQEVEIKPAIADDLMSARIALKYTGNSPSGVRLFVPLLTNWTCKVEDPNGKLLSFSDEVYVKSEPASVTCTRQGHVKDYERNGQKYDFWPASNINLQIGAQPFSISFEALSSPLLPEKEAIVLKRQVAEQGRILTPVGAVLPFFLSQEQIKMLEPQWLPADGRQVEDKNSPFFGQKLPNLTERFIRGSKPDEDVVTDELKTVGGADPVSLSGSFSVSTGNEVRGPNQGERGDNNGQGNYVTDTRVNETDVSNHTHPVNGSVTVSGSAMPPFRTLVYLVRVLP